MRVRVKVRVGWHLVLVDEEELCLADREWLEGVAGEQDAALLDSLGRRATWRAVERIRVHAQGVAMVEPVLATAIGPRGGVPAV
jgi:hypothetical protein